MKTIRKQPFTFELACTQYDDGSQSCRHSILIRTAEQIGERIKRLLERQWAMPIREPRPDRTERTNVSTSVLFPIDAPRLGYTRIRFDELTALLDRITWEVAAQLPTWLASDRARWDTRPPEHGLAFHGTAPFVVEIQDDKIASYTTLTVRMGIEYRGRRP